MTDSSDKRLAYMVNVLAIGIVSSMILAALFGGVLYLFGFGATLIAVVVQSQIIGVWYVNSQLKPSRSRDAIVGQVFFVLIALLAFGVGIHAVCWK